MFLSSVVLHGFKSFADLTRFDFTPGLNVIVGPDGCGKSCMVGAIRWVLDGFALESVTPHEFVSEEVLFSGTDRRQPARRATVTLSLSDCPPSWSLVKGELQITREATHQDPNHLSNDSGRLDALGVAELLAASRLEPETVVLGPADPVEGPVTVLDECDAGFDEARIESYAELLESLRPRTQLIVVTPNKRIMALAETLQGVTMEEFGVSKPVRMRLR